MWTVYQHQATTPILNAPTIVYKLNKAKVNGKTTCTKHARTHALKYAHTQTAPSPKHRTWQYCLRAGAKAGQGRALGRAGH